MGFFTWTVATENSNNRSFGYGRRGYVACPDGKFIREDGYNGYGIFGGHDVYNLVVDWNRAHLRDIYDSLEKKHELWNAKMKPIAMAAMESDEAAQKVADELFAQGIISSLEQQEWKRTVGITIGCEHNDELPYPIKITTNTRVPYARLQPSISIQ